MNESLTEMKTCYLRNERTTESDAANESTEEKCSLDACSSWVDSKTGKVVQVGGKTSGHSCNAHQRVKGSNELRKVSDLDFRCNCQTKRSTTSETSSNVNHQFGREVHETKGGSQPGGHADQAQRIAQT